jgi:hypothetical protein
MGKRQDADHLDIVWIDPVIVDPERERRFLEALARAADRLKAKEAGSEGGTLCEGEHAGTVESGID